MVSVPIQLTSSCHISPTRNLPHKSAHQVLRQLPTPFRQVLPTFLSTTVAITRSLVLSFLTSALTTPIIWNHLLTSFNLSIGSIHAVPHFYTASRVFGVLFAQRDDKFEGFGIGKIHAQVPEHLESRLTELRYKIIEISSDKYHTAYVR